MSCTAFLKVLHWIYKSCLGIIGTLLTVIGAASYYIYATLQVNNERILNDLAIIPPLGTLIFGIALMLIVLIGCCTIRKYNLCLNTYATLVIILSLLQLSFGAFCVIMYTEMGYMESLNRQLNVDLGRAVDQYSMNPEPMDRIQGLLKCCGNRDAAREYLLQDELPQDEDEGLLPPSCCPEDVPRCTPEAPGLYAAPCAEALLKYSLGCACFLGWLSVAVGCVELIGGLISVCLSCTWRNF